MSEVDNKKLAAARALDAIDAEMAEVLADLKVYVWRGDEVLRDYSSGIVVVAAESAETAWEKLRAADFRAWFWLRTGVAWVFSEDEARFVTPEDYTFENPIEPEEFSVADLPVLVKPGGA